MFSCMFSGTSGIILSQKATSANANFREIVGFRQTVEALEISLPATELVRSSHLARLDRMWLQERADPAGNSSLLIWVNLEAEIASTSVSRCPGVTVCEVVLCLATESHKLSWREAKDVGDECHRG
jgi:hypothetical protein